MRKINPLVNLEILIGLALLIPYFFWQIKVNSGLNQQIQEKRKRLNKIENARINLAALEKQMQDIIESEDLINKRAPINEEQPLSLIKSLINIGNESALRDITVGLKKEVQAPDNNKSSSGSEPAVAEVKAVYLEMRFEAVFSQLPIFLEKLAKLDRVVSVKGVKVERDEKVLPYQKIALDLATYTFQE